MCFKSFDPHGQQAERWHVEIRSATRAVHQHPDSSDLAPVSAHDFDSFLNPASFSHYVFDDEDFLARDNFESAPEHKFAFLFFDEHETEAELTGNFLAEHQSAHGG